MILIVNYDQYFCIFLEYVIIIFLIKISLFFIFKNYFFHKLKFKWEILYLFLTKITKICLPIFVICYVQCNLTISNALPMTL